MGRGNSREAGGGGQHQLLPRLQRCGLGAERAAGAGEEPREAAEGNRWSHLLRSVPIADRRPEPRGGEGSTVGGRVWGMVGRGGWGPLSPAGERLHGLELRPAQPQHARAADLCARRGRRRVRLVREEGRGVSG